MSTIIKAAGTSRNSVQNIQQVAFNFSDIAQQAGNYLDQIRAEAAKIVDEAHQQARKIRAAAEAEGRGAAIEAANRQVDERVARQMETLLTALYLAVEEIQQSRGAWMGHWQASAVHVATAIARRVIRRELSAAPEIALDRIKEALELAAGSAKITIHLNPADHETLGEEARRLIDQLRPLASATLVADAGISPGGCRLETKFGAIDQQCEAQLARIAEELNG